MIIPLNRSKPTASDIQRIAAALDAGQPVVLPTETQYALTCDATSAAANDRVRAIKGRQLDAPFSVFFAGIDALPQWRIQVPDTAWLLASAFLPGPLTLILPTTNPIFKLLGGDGKTVGVRVTPEPVIARVLGAINKPLIATSANPSGAKLTSTRENHWLDSLARRGEIVWAKPARYIRRTASTIIDCTGKVPRELRPGPISNAEWNAVLSRGV